MDYCDTGCMLGRAPRTKNTLPDFCENMDFDKWDTIMWYRVKSTRILRVDGLSTGPQDLSVTAWYQSLGKRLPRGLNVGIHKYSPDTIPSQLGIKSLGTRVPRANGHRSRSCIVVRCVFRA